MADDGKKTTVGEMSAEEFAALMLRVFEHAQGTKDGKRRIADLTAEEFTESIIQSVKMGSLRTAAAESEVANKILRDWTGLMHVQAATQPFRVKETRDVHAMAANLLDQVEKARQAVAGNGFRAAGVAPPPQIEFVVVVAVAHPDGTYSEYRR